MKEIFLEDPSKFDLVDSVERYNGKFNLKRFFKEYWGFFPMLVAATLISLKKAISLTSFVFNMSKYVVIMLMVRFVDKKFNKKTASTELDMSLFCEEPLGIKTEDFKNAVIYTKEPKQESYWLCNGKGRVDSKKVVSYIALPEKQKFTVLKQILTQFKYENTEIKDTELTQLFLLEENDLIKERILTEDGHLNKNNPLVKKLLNTKYYR